MTLILRMLGEGDGEFLDDLVVKINVKRMESAVR
jgi:hypothetical protein